MVTIKCQAVEFLGVKAVILDKDGTLANSQDYLRQLGQKRARLIDAQVPGVQEPLLLAFGLEGSCINPAGLLAVGSRQENVIAAAAYVAETGRNWIDALHLVRSAFAEADQMLPRKSDSTPLFEGSVSLLKSLAAAGLKIGVLSADSTANVKDFLDRYHLNEWVQLGMGTDNGPHKPDPAPFWQACEKLGVPPDQVLMIGDAMTDLEMANAAGAAGSIGVTWGWTGAIALHTTAIAKQFQDIQVVP